MDYYIHPQAQCESNHIGENTRIWAFAYILEGARIGRDANVCSHTFIEDEVVIGDRVTIKSGVQLWNGIRIEDDVFIGPNATFTNDHMPRSKANDKPYEKTLVCAGASIGANATILPGVTIGPKAMIGAGAVVTRSIPANAVVKGNPARIRGYANAVKSGDSTIGVRLEEGETIRDTSVTGVSLHRMRFSRDMRGSLIAGEFGKDIPFEPKRSFFVFDVPGAEVRGEHAHKLCHQFIVCLRGACSVVVDDGERREELRLDQPETGLYVPPMRWTTQFAHTRDALLFVLASEHYDPDDYIRAYDEFLAEIADSPD